MKKKWIIVAAIAVVALALIVILGGWAIGRSSGGGDTEPTSPATPTEDVSATPSGTGVDGLPPIDMTLPGSDSQSGTQAGGTGNGSASPTPIPAETIVEDENGNQTITPNWSTDKLPDDANVVSKSPDANMGGSGGGKLPTDSDGNYHGDHPDQQPTATAQPTDTPDATQPSTPPTTTPTQPSTPAPTQPSNPPSDNGGPPSYNGNDGDISPDGKYEWWNGFGWVEMGTGNGGEGGNYYDPDWKLSGEKVGDM